MPAAADEDAAADGDLGIQFDLGNLAAFDTRSFNEKQHKCASPGPRRCLSHAPLRSPTAVADDDTRSRCSLARSLARWLAGLTRLVLLAFAARRKSAKQGGGEVYLIERATERCQLMIAKIFKLPDAGRPKDGGRL